MKSNVTDIFQTAVEIKIPVAKQCVFCCRHKNPNTSVDALYLTYTYNLHCCHPVFPCNI